MKRIRFITQFLAVCLLVFVSGRALADLAPEAVKEAENLYQNHCLRCHGDTGGGDGPAYTLQRPRPRDFTSGEYKFRSTPAGTLPTVSDIERVIAKGNLRTSMAPYENILSADQIRLLAEYVLNISRKHSGVPDGAGSAFQANSALNDRSAAAEELRDGREVYKAHCSSCHGENGRGLGPLSQHLYDKNGFWTAMPDLTDTLAYAGGSTPSDIWMRSKTGIIMSQMPSFDGVISDEDLEKTALYIRSLQKPPSGRTLISRNEWREALPAKARGEYMTRSMSCALCHNSYDETGMYYPDLYLAGGVAITLPGLGVYYTKNITPHPDGNIDDWTEEEIAELITTGYAPDGSRIEAFAMPWPFFSNLTEEDALDIAVFLKNLKPVQNNVPKRYMYPFHQRIWTRVRQLLGLEHGRLEYPPFNQGTRQGKEENP